MNKLSRFCKQLFYFRSFHPKKDFKLLLLNFLVFLVLIPLIGIGTYSSINTTHMMQRQIENANKQGQKRISDMITINLDSVKRLVQSIAANPNIQSMDESRMGSILIGGTRTNAMIDGLSVVDRNGKMIYNTNGIYRNVSQTAYFKSAFQGKGGFSDILISKINHKPIEFYYSEPVSVGSNVVGVVTAVIKVRTLSEFIEHVQNDRSANTFIVDHTGTVIAHRSWDKFNRTKLYQHFQPVRDVLSGHEIQGIYAFKNISLLTVATPIPQLKAGIVTAVPRSAAFADVDLQNRIFIFIVIAALLLCALAALCIAEFVTRPVMHLSDVMQIIAGNDFTAHVADRYVRRKDQFGSMARNFNQLIASQRVFLQKIKHMISEVENANGETSRQVGDLVQSGQDVGTAMNELAVGTEAQAKNMMTVTDKFSVLEDRLSRINKSVRTIVRYTEESKSKNQSGAQAIESLTSIFKETYQSTQDVSKGMHVLEEHSEEIKGITSAIESLTDQTNLLSLNASIEAARAGDADRGFAVVADEIRKLSEQSATAAKRIQRVISNMLDIVQNIARATEQTKTSADLSNQELRQTAGMFQSMIEHAGSLIENVATLNDGIRHLHADRRAVGTYIENTSSIFEESSATTEEVNATMETQVEATRRMKEKIAAIHKETNELLAFISSYKTE